MEIRRIVSYLIVAVLAIFLWHAWLRDNPPPAQSPEPTKTPSSTTQATGKGVDFTPGTFTSKQKISAASETKAETPPSTADKVSNDRTLIQVKTDVLHVAIDAKNGNIVSAKLLKYPDSLQEKDIPVQILSGNPDNLYIAQSGLTETKITFDAKRFQLLGKDQQPISLAGVKNKQITQVTLQDQNQLVVVLQGKDSRGMAVTLRYIFSRGSYAIKMAYTLKNQTQKVLQTNLYTQFVQKEPEKSGHKFYTRSYTGGAISSPNTPYKKLTYKAMNAKPLDQIHKGGWVAFQQHYFLSAWIPSSQQQVNHYYSHVESSNSGNNTYVLGFVSPQVSIAPGKSVTSSATMYVGPEIAKYLKKLAPGLDHTIDYGWLWPISVLLFQILNFIYMVVGNWGWAIVITTIIIKIVFYWFSATSFRSMARMREMQPRMKQLKERYADDKQALSRATMELYKKEKINPLGGCLPMLIQIPVFIALYYVLIESVQLRQAPFIFWIHDLSAKDPYYVLPVLMGLSMLVQQKLTPASPDPAQAKMMMILPVVFTVFFINFPSGLVLYWLVNNCVQSLQQWYVMKTYETHKAKKENRRRKRNK